ncbi:hypothetical protein J6590_018068 [Homalodisca vitripennis]|nr:hypothetical protein J6590_018068 [Homalodisca vitripennis]
MVKTVCYNVKRVCIRACHQSRERTSADVADGAARTGTRTSPATLVSTVTQCVAHSYTRDLPHTTVTSNHSGVHRLLNSRIVLARREAHEPLLVQLRMRKFPELLSGQNYSGEKTAGRISEFELTSRRAVPAVRGVALGSLPPPKMERRAGTSSRERGRDSFAGARDGTGWVDALIDSEGRITHNFFLLLPPPSQGGDAARRLKEGVETVPNRSRSCYLYFFLLTRYVGHSGLSCTRY